MDRRRLRLGAHLFVSFQRTVRLTAGSSNPPRSYGAAPLWPADAASARDLAADVLLPVGDGEAVWIGLEPADERVASALRVAVKLAPGTGLIDAVTGSGWSDEMRAAPRNYVVAPPQRALYGVTAGAGLARQLVRADTASGEPAAAIARIRLVYAPPRRVTRLPPPPDPLPILHAGAPEADVPRPARGVTDEGFVIQRIAADPYGPGHWDVDRSVAVTVRPVSHEEFARRSGLPRPEPLDPAGVYGGWRLP